MVFLTERQQSQLQPGPWVWVLRNVYADWARQDAAGARQAAMALEDGRHKSQALAGVMREWLSEDPLQALSWLDALPVDGAVHQSKRQVLQELLKHDFELAQFYVEGKTNPLERRKVLEGLNFRDLAMHRDVAGIRELYDWVGTVATGQMYDNKITELLRSMASSNPDGARDFVLSMPDGSARLHALSAVGAELARVEPGQALAFAQTLDYADERRRVLSSMGRTFSQAVEDAAHLVAVSSNPEVQQQLAQRALPDWSQFDHCLAGVGVH